jgi:hypothetical protein
MKKFMYECIYVYTYMCMYKKGKVMDVAGEEGGRRRKRHGRVKADKLVWQGSDASPVV